MREKAELSGIGGWLILIAIGQLVGPLKFLGSLAPYYSNPDVEALRINFPIVFFIEAVLNASFLVIMVVTTVFFFTKSRWFPTFFIFEYAAAILVGPLDVAVSALGLSIYTGRPISFFAEQMLTPKEVGQWIPALVSAAVWIPYILNSKRVANTFPPREDLSPAAPYGEWSQVDHETFKRLLKEKERQNSA